MDYRNELSKGINHDNQLLRRLESAKARLAAAKASVAREGVEQLIYPRGIIHFLLRGWHE